MGQGAAGRGAEAGGGGGERQREAGQAQGGGAVAGTAGFAEVVADRPRGGEQDQRQILFGAEQAGVVLDQPVGEGGQPVVAKGLRDGGGLTAVPEAVQVVGEAERAVSEGA